ncbi:cysteine proteinase inhibitor 5-like [Vicia villosa]|uniref:cysteine proteinase inhibitor 5-like n=1 Tax=Vicia villosa TaxID=3911 RepID=UPI00273CEB8B|nr:cysteine proteinase inhibitor 5-like [Vicia villosa]
MKLQTLILLIVFLIASAAARKQHAAGGYNTITNINDPHVIEIANFAVTQYNKQSGAKLKLKKVIKGEYQVVAGINYRLTLSAGEGSVSEIYEAVVWEKSWLHFRNLTSFKPLDA